MKIALSAAAVAAFVLSVAIVHAAPVAPLGAAAQRDVVLVAQACGIGWHRGPYGGCRRNLSPVWPCWWVRGPFGRWRLVCH